MMKISRRAVAAALFCLALAGGVCLAGNIAAEGVITASSVPNPAWAPENVSDGDTGPTKGWLGDWSAAGAGPWIQFKFRAANKVSAVRVMQAGLPEAGRDRFSRPKKLRVLFFKDGKSSEKTIELKDREHVFQNLEMEPVEAESVRIEVLDVYPGARIPEMAGFQEIEILSDGAVPGSGSKGALGRGDVQAMSDAEIADAVREVLSKKDEPEAAPKIVEKAPSPEAEKKTESAGKPGISEEERDILRLLDELMKKLEERFKRD